MISGGCLCGAVRYQVEGDPVMTGRCCCTSCQKLSGGGHADNMAFVEDGLSITGEVRDFIWTADSGAQVTTGFCPRCGSPLFGQSSSMPGIKVVRVGSLDDPSIYAPQMLVYASRRHPWAVVDEALPAFATMPPMG